MAAPFLAILDTWAMVASPGIWFGALKVVGQGLGGDHPGFQNVITNADWLQQMGKAFTHKYFSLRLGVGDPFHRDNMPPAA